MTRKLESLFDLPESDSVEETKSVIEHNRSELTEINNTIDKIDAALPGVRGLDASDAEMDDLAAKATESFSDLMDLGMQVDSRYASEIFAVAGQMLGHAITAKNAKLTKKLKMIELQLKKARLDQDANANGEAALPTASGHVVDPNELLRQLISKDSEESKS